MSSAKKNIAVLTGAGMSAESGLSTFRGNNGLWGEYDPEEVATKGMETFRNLLSHETDAMLQRNIVM